MTLPYENATSGKNAVAEMQEIPKGFGASSFGVMEDFGAGEVIVQFEHRGHQVTIKASLKGYAAAWRRHHARSPRAMKQAEIAVYSILRDWIKGQVTAIEVGMLSFEGAFLGQLMLPNGQTVLERIEETKLLSLPAANT